VRRLLGELAGIGGMALLGVEGHGGVCVCGCGAVVREFWAGGVGGEEGEEGEGRTAGGDDCVSGEMGGWVKLG